jgi:hypothetical protein
MALHRSGKQRHVGGGVAAINTIYVCIRSWSSEPLGVDVMGKIRRDRVYPKLDPHVWHWRSYSLLWTMSPACDMDGINERAQVFVDAESGQKGTECRGRDVAFPTGIPRCRAAPRNRAPGGACQGCRWRSQGWAGLPTLATLQRILNFCRSASCVPWRERAQPRCHAC